jgi:hypothetical protein
VYDSPSGASRTFSLILCVPRNAPVGSNLKKTCIRVEPSAQVLPRPVRGAANKRVSRTDQGMPACVRGQSLHWPKRRPRSTVSSHEPMIGFAPCDLPSSPDEA